MEIWINDEEIINRIYNRISDLSEENKLLYDNSNLSFQFNEIADKESALTHGFIIDFCLLTNTSYEYIVMGKTPICDSGEKNKLYKRLIEKNDFTI